MIFNGENLGIPTIKASYVIKRHSSDKYIEITKDNISFCINFNNKEFDPKESEKNKKINLVEYLYWDVELVTNETYYLFDLTKDKVYLTRLDDNLYNIEIKINNPDMIYSPSGGSFDNLYINANFSFVY